jgi:hypothetical protein
VDKESFRLSERRELKVPWQKWGPYLSERQWGTVREDYSGSGNAWDYFTHDQARSRAYRWGEDGIAGISDDEQRLCIALALWNGTDPILKERLFGLTNGEGNHGEDVKEYYYYLDATPTHSYLKYLYKYPQRPFPYVDLITTNRERNRDQFEYELIETDAFDDDRYFDVFVEYAKASPEDLLGLITIHNRGPQAAPIHVLPTFWFRNTWFTTPDALRPSLRSASAGGHARLTAAHPQLGERTIDFDGDVALLFTDNETNEARVFGTAGREGYWKDGINDFIVAGRSGSINPAQTGTKAAAHYRFDVPAGGSVTVRFRMTDRAPARTGRGRSEEVGTQFDEIVADRRREADEFYATALPASMDDEARLISRQALAGMIWTKQFYSFDIEHWIAQRGNTAPRNREWVHMINHDVISMPDKWEYPWYAAWDLAFHMLPLAIVDIDFAKHQLDLLVGEMYQHPNGQLPAYEWNFSDVNPPVHAWATMYVYNMEKEARGEGDIRFLERVFNKLLMNFTWWVNRKDRHGRNLFDGGFLGLDNIGVFDRSAPLPNGAYLEQADGTAWMAFFCQGMLDIALELAIYNPIHENLAYRFVEHFLRIASAMDRIGEHQDELWDEEDGFFYDVVRLGDGRSKRLKVRSMVGLLPLCATTVIEREVKERYPGVIDRVRRFLERHPELAGTVTPPTLGHRGRSILTVVNEHKLRRILARMLDEREFLSPYGIRALSRAHLDDPYVLRVGDAQYSVGYEPAESTSGMFGGNSNWRGPVWFPVNALILRALAQYYLYCGDDFLVECPTGSGRLMNLYQVTEEIGRRLVSVFRRDASGRRPVFGGAERFQTDPHWRDHLLFYEYFHGDNGAGLGASHQTGWTGLVARIAQMGHLRTAAELLEQGRLVRSKAAAAHAEVSGAPSATV